MQRARCKSRARDKCCHVWSAEKSSASWLFSTTAHVLPRLRVRFVVFPHTLYALIRLSPALTDCSMWVLDRSVFQLITQRLGMQRHAKLLEFLRKVKIFQDLGEDRLSKMTDCLDQVPSFALTSVCLRALFSGVLRAQSLHHPRGREGRHVLHHRDRRG